MQDTQETQVPSLGWEDPLEEMATHPSILAWSIPWTEELGGLQSMGSQRIRHDWVINAVRLWGPQHCPQISPCVRHPFTAGELVVFAGFSWLRMNSVSGSWLLVTVSGICPGDPTIPELLIWDLWIEILVFTLGFTISFHWSPVQPSLSLEGWWSILSWE